MSLTEGSMAAQSAEVHHAEASSSSSPFPQGISFVKSIDRKARSYFKTLERSLSFSMGDSKEEDSSAMTIEFLHTRLQAQRAEHKAEKQRSEMLAKRVLELEQRLNFEIEQRRKAEGLNMQAISSDYHVGESSSQSKHTRSFSGRDFLDFKLKNRAFGEDDPYVLWPDDIENADHLDGDGVFLTSPSMWNCQEICKCETQQQVDQYAISQFNEGINVAIGPAIGPVKDSFTLNHRDRPCETTRCGELALSVEELQGSLDRASAKFQANRQSSALYDTDKSLKRDFSQQSAHASPIHSCCQNYGVKLSMHPAAKMVTSNVLLQREKLASVESYAKRPTKFTNLSSVTKSVCIGCETTSGYIAPLANTTKSMQEEAYSRKQLNDECRSIYMKEALNRESLTDNMPKANSTLKICRSMSDVEARYGGKVCRHRISLDGGLNRLKKADMEGAAARF